MRIGFETVDWSQIRDRDGFPVPGGAGWYRIVMPAQHLRRNGVDAIYGLNLGMKPSGEMVIQDLRGEIHEDLDIIVLQRWMDEHAADAIRRARSTGQVIINEVDDYFDGLDPANGAFRVTHPKYNPHANRLHYKRALMASSAITVSTPFLAEKLTGGPPVYVLENCIDLDRWPQRDVSGEPIVGWVGMTSHRSGDLEILRGAIGTFLKKNGVAFHHAGHLPQLPSAFASMAIPDEVPVSAEAPIGIHQYTSLFEHFNIGIVPLADKAFNKSKSFIKGLEYAASGIPFVASDTPEYRKLQREGAGATVGPRARDWHRELGKLLDSETRVSAGKAARAAAVDYDMAHRWQDWLSVYERVLRLNTQRVLH